MSHIQLKAPLEALLFASGEPLSPEKAASILEVTCEDIKTAFYELMHDMEKNECGLMVREVSEGYQLVTKPQYASLLKKIVERPERQLSAAMMETLAIIAFKQPLTRAEIEAIRGVSADHVLAGLLNRKLVKEIGRKEVPGRPILYATTDLFLTCAGIESIQDLNQLVVEIPG